RWDCYHEYRFRRDPPRLSVPTRAGIIARGVDVVRCAGRRVDRAGRPRSGYGALGDDGDHPVLRGTPDHRGDRPDGGVVLVARVERLLPELARGDPVSGRGVYVRTGPWGRGPGGDAFAGGVLDRQRRVSNCRGSDAPLAAVGLGAR